MEDIPEHWMQAAGRLRDPRPDVRREALAQVEPGWLAFDGLRQVLCLLPRDPDGGVREAAVRKLATIGPDAESLPHRIRVALGQEAVDRLPYIQSGSDRDTADHPDPPLTPVDRRCRRARQIGGSPRRPNVPKIAELLADEEATVRESCVRALFRHLWAGFYTELHPSDILALLSGSLADPVPAIRHIATEAMGKAAAAAGRHQAALCELLEDPETRIRAAAAAALKEIGPDVAAVPGVADRVIAATYDPDPLVLAEATMALARLAPTQPAVVSRLIALLADGRARVRRVAARASGWHPAPAPALVRALVATLQDPDEIVRQQSARSLGRLRHGVPDVVRALARRLRDAVTAVREGSADALSDLGRAAALVVDDLLATLPDPSPAVRVAAAAALAGTGLTGEPIIGALRRMLGDAHPDVRETAATGLEWLAPASAQSVEDLADLLRDRIPAVRLAAVRALARMGPAAAMAAPALLRASRSADSELARAALDAIAALGPAAAQLAPQLARAGEVETLMAIGAAALPQLELLLETEHCDRAAVALARVTRDAPSVIGALLRRRLAGEPVDALEYALLSIDPDLDDVAPGLAAMAGCAGLAHVPMSCLASRDEVGTLVEHLVGTMRVQNMRVQTMRVQTMRVQTMRVQTMRAEGTPAGPMMSAAAWILSLAGPAAVRALPVLQAMLGKESARHLALRTIAHIAAVSPAARAALSAARHLPGCADLVEALLPLVARAAESGLPLGLARLLPHRAPR